MGGQVQVNHVKEQKTMESRKVFAFVGGALLAVCLVVAFFYVRQRLFTQTEPIVLTS